MNSAIPMGESYKYQNCLAQGQLRKVMRLVVIETTARLMGQKRTEWGDCWQCYWYWTLAVWSYVAAVAVAAA
jgi:hypothetical protein